MLQREIIIFLFLLGKKGFEVTQSTFGTFGHFLCWTVFTFDSGFFFWFKMFSFSFLWVFFRFGFLWRKKNCEKRNLPRRGHCPHGKNFAFTRACRRKAARSTLLVGFFRSFCKYQPLETSFGLLLAREIVTHTRTCGKAKSALLETWKLKWIEAIMYAFILPFIGKNDTGVLRLAHRLSNPWKTSEDIGDWSSAPHKDQLAQKQVKASWGAKEKITGKKVFLFFIWAERGKLDGKNISFFFSTPFFKSLFVEQPPQQARRSHHRPDTTPAKRRLPHIHDKLGRCPYPAPWQNAQGRADCWLDPTVSVDALSSAQWQAMTPEQGYAPSPKGYFFKLRFFWPVLNLGFFGQKNSAFILFW